MRTISRWHYLILLAAVVCVSVDLMFLGLVFLLLWAMVAPGKSAIWRTRVLEIVNLEELGRARSWLSALGHGSLAVFCCLGLSFLFMALEQRFLKLDPSSLKKFFELGDPNWSDLAFAVCGGPIVEEIFFRGLIFNAMARRFGIWSGVGVSAALFGYLHFNGFYSSVLSAMMFGTLMCALFMRGRSIVFPILLHSLHNAILLLSGSGVVAVFFNAQRVEWVGIVLFIVGLPSYVTLFRGGLVLRRFLGRCPKPRVGELQSSPTYPSLES